MSKVNAGAIAFGSLIAMVAVLMVLPVIAPPKSNPEPVSKPTQVVLSIPFHVVGYMPDGALVAVGEQLWHNDTAYPLPPQSQRATVSRIVTITGKAFLLNTAGVVWSFQPATSTWTQESAQGEFVQSFAMNGNRPTFSYRGVGKPGKTGGSEATADLLVKGDVSSMVVSPNQEYLTVGYEDGGVELTSRQLVSFRIQDSDGQLVNALSWSKDGRFLFYGKKGAVRVWDEANPRDEPITLQLIGLNEDEQVRQIATDFISGDLAILTDRQVIIAGFKADSGGWSAQSESLDQGVWNSIAWSPDGKTLTAVGKGGTAHWAM